MRARARARARARPWHGRRRRDGQKRPTWWRGRGRLTGGSSRQIASARAAASSFTIDTRARLGWAWCRRRRQLGAGWRCSDRASARACCHGCKREHGCWMHACSHAMSFALLALALALPHVLTSRAERTWDRMPSPGKVWLS